ncbi:MAG: aspartyl protease family protein [Bacteroidales bacterium]|jgi:hypothetical protein|nr:aspartyl protease family protein [Bacteroidales bacterium]
MEEMPYSLTRSYDCITDSIITSVEVENTVTGSKLQTEGIWDTGATGSVITKSAAVCLGLTPEGIVKVRGVHGVKEVNMYYVKIILDNKNIVLKTRVTECDELSSSNSTGMLIGMDVITLGDFSITNFGEQTVMSFRVPSLGKVDFTD